MVGPMYQQPRPTPSTARVAKHPTAEALETFLRESGINEHLVTPTRDYSYLVEPCDRLFRALYSQAHAGPHSTTLKHTQMARDARNTSEMVCQLITADNVMSRGALEQISKSIGSSSGGLLSGYPITYAPDYSHAHTARISHSSQKAEYGHLPTAASDISSHTNPPGEFPLLRSGNESKLESGTRQSAGKGDIKTPTPIGGIYERDAARRIHRPREGSKEMESGSSADPRASPVMRYHDKYESYSYRHRALTQLPPDPLGPTFKTLKIPYPTTYGAPAKEDVLRRLLRATKSPVYDPSRKMSESDTYDDDNNPGYRAGKDKYEFVPHPVIDDEVAVTRDGLIYHATLFSSSRRTSHSSTLAMRQEEGGAFSSLQSNSSSTTPRSIQTQITSVHRGSGSPTEVPQAAGDDELFKAYPASPSAPSTVHIPVVDPQPRLVTIEKPTIDTSGITFVEPPILTAPARSQSPTFGKVVVPDELTHRNELVPPLTLEEHQSSPTFGGAQQQAPQQIIAPPVTHEDITAIVDRAHDDTQNQRVKEDAEKWDKEYAKGSHTRLRREKQAKKRELAALTKICHISYEDGDWKFPVSDRDRTWDCFALKVIYERDKTGFQDTRDFKASIDKVIAGRYQIINEIGNAAFSTTFRCRDLQANKDVCLKVIKNSKDYIDQSLDEIQILRYIGANIDPDSSRCLKLLDFFYFEEHLMLVTELLGDNLYCFETRIRNLKQGRFFSLGRIQKIAYQILEALCWIHSLRLIHSDLKPENIVMVDEEYPHVKLIDFGSACFEDDNLSTYVQSRSYRAPEVILGLCYDQKIDIWSLGCVLAELWTGFVLFQNQCVQSMLARIVSIIGQIPAYMVQNGKHRKHLFTADGRIMKVIDNYQDPVKGRLLHIYFPKKSSLEQRMRTDDQAFLAFLTSLLQIDPVKRPTANEALQDPWFTPGRYEDGL